MTFKHLVPQLLNSSKYLVDWCLSCQTGLYLASNEVSSGPLGPTYYDG